jgi:CheY-like chemotaxis protein
MPIAQALIIDDNANNILVLQQLLRMEGVGSVALASTANLAESLNAYEDIDIVFLDLEMPKADGYKSLPIIRSHPNFRDARVIAYSVHANEIHTALDLGFDGFLGKPLSAELFPDHLARILRGERVRYIP